MQQADFSAFANPEFDANDYANAVLAGDPYLPSQIAKSKVGKSRSFHPAKEDISVVISKLDYGIDEISKQLKGVVTTYHEELLVRAAGVNDLQTSLSSVRFGLDELDGSLEKLRLKIRMPYQALQTNVVRLEKLQQAADVLRRTSRFVTLARRLETQMAILNDDSAQSARNLASSPSSKGPASTEPEEEKERTIAKAALSVAELVALLDASDENAGDGPSYEAPTLATDIPLRSIKAIAAHIPFIDASREKVTMEMESMVMNGLTNLNSSLLASSLQTAHNLRVLPELVQNLVVDLSEAVESRIQRAFDLAQISKEVTAKEPVAASQSILYRSRVRTEPTNITAPQWTSALWGRLEVMVEDMAGCCIKVYTLEKVLKLRRDPVSQMLFLDEAMKLLEDKPSLSFWHALARALEKQSKDAAKGSTFLQQTLSSSYPKLLRLFHDFFAKIALHTDTVYSQTQQSPETILVLRALNNFETLYLSKSSIRLNEAVGQAFIGGTRAPPGMIEGVNVARALVNEMDTARFDPLLVGSITKNAVASLELLISRLDALIVKDRSAVTLLGPTATLQQVSNAQVASCLYHCRVRLQKLKDEYPPHIFAILQAPLKSMERTQVDIMETLMNAIRRDLSATITRLHKYDFSKPMDADGGMGGNSLYMKELVDKLSFIKAEILSNFDIGEDGTAWTITIIRHVIRTFVLHVSIVHPLGESGKLQLTSDMTGLEFALSAFMTNSSQTSRGGNLQAVVGDDYRTLRSMRPLLFTENALLSSPKHTAGVPPLIVLHHILVRSPIPLPHVLHGWQEPEYVRWIMEHSAEEALTLIDGGITHWEKIAESEGTDTAEAAEYIRLARTVLAEAVVWE